MKTKLIIVLFLAPLLGYSQLQRSNSIVSGNVQWSSNTTVQPNGLHSKLTNLNLQSNYGWMISDRWMVGAGISLSNNKLIGNGTSSTFVSREAMIIGRRYIPVFEKFYVQIDGAVGYYSTKNTAYDPQFPSDIGTKTTGISFMVTPGVAYFIHPRFVVNGTLGNFRITKDTSPGPRIWNGQAAFGISRISLGAAFVF